MIVWVASFPRSGNTFLRIVLNRLYGIRTSTVYDVDGVAVRLGTDLIGFEERAASIDVMRDAEVLHFVKTHRPRDDQVGEMDRAICLVRDGRDALVSWARQRTETDEASFESELRARIDQPDEVGAGSWGQNVLSWLTLPTARRPMLRYEDLISDPTGAVRRIMTVLAPQMHPIDNASVPSFAQLHQLDDRFFRRGHPGTHHDEMTDELQQLFWSRSDNNAAMDMLGYSQTASTTSVDDTIVDVTGFVLEDDVLRLRPLSLDDVDEWMTGEDDEQIRWFEFPRPARREDVVRAIERWQDSWRSGGPVRQWAICNRPTGRIAGGVEVRDLGNGEVNLSYVVFPGFRRAGIASRAARLALRYAADEMGVTVAVIKILEGNAASFGVARRLGAVECGTAPSDAGGTFVVFRLALADRG